jgi:hypothetical protein
MTNIERLVPHILDLVDRSRWERQARLVGIIAARTWEGECWTELGIPQLVALGDNEERARWDMELLGRLAARDRVLDRVGSRRHPQGWRLAGDGARSVLQWRHVPWAVPRRHVLKQLLGVWETANVGWVAALAAQSLNRGAVRPLGDKRPGSLSRVYVPCEPLPGPQAPPPRPQFPGIMAAATASQTTAENGNGAGPTSSSRSVKDPVTPSLPHAPAHAHARQDEGGREGPEPTTAKGEKLIEALETATGLSISGWPRDALREACADELAEDYLVGWAGRRDLRRYRTATGLVRVLVEHWERIGRSNAVKQAAERVVKCPTCFTMTPGPCWAPDCPRRADG